MCCKQEGGFCDPKCSEREELNENEYILYGAYLAINRCQKIVREGIPNDTGWSIPLIKAFENLKTKLEKEVNGVQGKR